MNQVKDIRELSTTAKEKKKKAREENCLWQGQKEIHS